MRDLNPHLVYNACTAVVSDITVGQNSESNTGHVAEVREERGVLQSNQLAARALGDDLKAALFRE